MNGERTVVVTLVTGELLCGSRTQEEPWSTPLIHSSWKVAWAATVAARVAAMRSFLNILDLGLKQHSVEGESREQGLHHHIPLYIWPCAKHTGIVSAVAAPHLNFRSESSDVARRDVSSK